MNLFIIAKSNIRKKKSHMIILLVLITIANMVLYTGIHVLTRVGGFIDEKNESQNGAHIILQTNTGYDDEVVRILEGTKGYDYMEMEDFVQYTNSKYRNVSRTGKKEPLEMHFYNMDRERKISNLAIVDEGKKIKENSIVLPAYLKTAKGYQTGDEIEVSTGEKSYVYEIYGFLEDVMFSTPTNISVLKCFLPEGRFQELKEGSTGIVLRNYNVRLKSGYSTVEYEDSVSKALSDQLPDVASQRLLMNYDTMSMATGIVIYMLMAIVSLFGILILIVSIIVIRFSIVTNMENNLPSIGMLKASGYTNKQLGVASVIEFVCTSVIGILLGFLLSGASSRFITGQVSASIGLLWKTKMDLMAGTFSGLLIITIVFTVTWLAAGRLKRITPLTALRSGIEPHNFKKNHIPLVNSKFNLDTSIGLKGLLYHKKQNLAIVFIVSLLCFLCVFVISLYYNFVVSPEALVVMVGIEKPNVAVYNLSMADTEGDAGANLIAGEIEVMTEVSEVLHYNNYSLKLVNQDHEISVTADVCNDPSALKVNTLIDGRRPKHDNEITVTNLILKRLDAKLGDVVYVEEAGKKTDFIIVGVSQQISNLGLRALLNEEGMLRINENFKRDALYVYLNEKSDVDPFIGKLDKEFGERGIESMNFDNVYQTVRSSFTGALVAISIVFICITVIVIVLIIFLMIRMKLLRDRKTLGVYKALGYTTKQIIWQTVMSFAPSVSIGGLVGLLLAKLFASPAFAMMFSFAGIVNANIYVTTEILIGTFAFITIIAFLTAVLSSMGVGKIEPCKMLMEA